VFASAAVSLLSLWIISIYPHVHTITGFFITGAMGLLYLAILYVCHRVWGIGPWKTLFVILRSLLRRA
jgi:hypothetical protein